MSSADHHPERAAAEYLAGTQRPRARRRFEEHLLQCEECWREVRLARAGRALAEEAREVAPARLRETVRGAVALAGTTGRSRSRRGLVPATAVAAVLLVGTATAAFLVLGGEGQPEAIAAAVASFRANQVPRGSPPAHEAPDLQPAGLLLEGGAREIMGGQAVDAFSYGSADGDHLMLLIADRAFPVADGATGHSGDMHRWEAEADGVSMVCADRPMSYLMLAGDPVMLSHAEQALVSAAETT